MTKSGKSGCFSVPEKAPLSKRFSVFAKDQSGGLVFNCSVVLLPRLDQRKACAVVLVTRDIRQHRQHHGRKALHQGPMHARGPVSEHLRNAPDFFRLILAFREGTELLFFSNPPALFRRNAVSSRVCKALTFTCPVNNPLNSDVRHEFSGLFFCQIFLRQLVRLVPEDLLVFLLTIPFLIA